MKSTCDHRERVPMEIFRQPTQTCVRANSACWDWCVATPKIDWSEFQVQPAPQARVKIRVRSSSGKEFIGTSFFDRLCILIKENSALLSFSFDRFPVGVDSEGDFMQRVIVKELSRWLGDGVFESDRHV
jgi:hypothetical protein